MRTMKGNNKLILCEEEMIQMAESYLNTELFKSDFRVIVTGVKQNAAVGNYTFEILLGEAEPLSTEGN